MAKPTTPVLQTGHELYSGLVALLCFTEGSGTSVADLTVNNNDGTADVDSWGSDATYGPYWENTGTDELRISSSSSLQAITSSVTWGGIVWCDDQTAASRYGALFALDRVGNPDRKFDLNGYNYDDDGYASIETADGLVSQSSTLDTASVLRDGSWHWVHIVYDGSTLKYYEDGVELNSVAATGSLANTADWLFGLNGAGNYQADLRVAYSGIWNRALSSGEITRQVADPWGLISSSYTATLDDTGFTDLGTAAQTIYVSQSEGDNANDGLTSGTPKLTLAAGEDLLRDGYADHMLLKRGDTWTNERFTAWDKSGSSVSAKMVIGAYGTGDRPVVTSPSGNWWYNNAGVEHLAIVSLEIQGSNGEYAGINSLVAMNDILLEDLAISGFNDGIILQGEYTGAGGLTRHQDCTVRRCVIYDNYQGSTGHSQGIFAKACDGLIIEENFFDRNGWISDRDTEATIYNHNAYLQYDNGDIIFRKNWSSRASSHAVQQRAGGWQEDNTYYKNPITGAIGWNTNESPHTSGFKCYLRRNITVDSDDITSSLPRGIGHGISNASEGDIADNLVIHVGTDATGTHKGIGGASNNLQWTATVRRNVVYKWNQGIGFAGTGYTSFVLTGNEVQSCNDEVYQSDSGCDADSAALPGDNQFWSALAANARYVTAGTAETNFAGWQSTTGDSTSTETSLSGSYTDPEKDMDDYAVSIGLTDAAEMLTYIRLQRKGNWDTQLETSSINAYFRANFDMAPAATTVTATKDDLEVDLTWEGPPEATEYIVQRRVDGGSWETIG